MLVGYVLDEPLQNALIHGYHPAASITGQVMMVFRKLAAEFELIFPTYIHTLGHTKLHKQADGSVNACPVYRRRELLP